MRSQTITRRQDDCQTVRCERSVLVLVAGDMGGLRKSNSKPSSFARSLPWPAGGKWSCATRGNTAPASAHARHALVAMRRETAVATTQPQLRQQPATSYAGRPARGCSLGTV